MPIWAQDQEQQWIGLTIREQEPRNSPRLEFLGLESAA
jgi:hypothetical protein